MHTSDHNQTRIIGKGSATAKGPGPNVMAASTLSGNNVYASGGEDIGKIKEIMLDVRSGRIAYAVLSRGGLLGVGEKLFAIPWNALTLDIDRKCFLLAISFERINTAPAFDKDHWPVMADPLWAGSLHEYYGSAPYWAPSDDAFGMDAPPNEAAPEGLKPRGRF